MELKEKVSSINQIQKNHEDFENHLKNNLFINPIGVGIISRLMKEQKIKSSNYIKFVSKILSIICLYTT